MQMSVLDDLENYWEKTDAIHGKKGGVLAEHIMDREASNYGSAAKGKWVKHAIYEQREEDGLTSFRRIASVYYKACILNVQTFYSKNYSHF